MLDRCGEPFPTTQLLTAAATAVGGVQGGDEDARAHGHRREHGRRQQQTPPRHLVPAALLCALKALEHQSRSKVGLKHTAVDSLVGLLMEIHHTFRQPSLPPALGSAADAAADHASTTSTSSAGSARRSSALSGDFGGSSRKGSVLAPQHVKVLEYSNRLRRPRLSIIHCSNTLFHNTTTVTPL